MKRTVSLIFIALLACGAYSQKWEMEGKDRYGTFRADVGPPLSSLTTPWIYRRNTGEIASHNVALDGTGLAYRTGWVSNLARKFDALTGIDIATFNTLNYAQSSPALAPDGSAIYIHAARSLPFNPPGRLYKINTATMDFDWFVDTNIEKYSDWEAASPIVGPDGDVVFGAGSARRYDDITGVPVWATPLAGDIRRSIPFTRDDSKVVVAHGNSISGLDYATGAVVWTRGLGSRVGAPGVAPDGVIVVGSEAGNVYGLNPTDGAIIWSKPTLGAVVVAPAFSNTGVAYTAGYDWRLNAFRTTDGFKLWSHTSTHELRSAPAVDGNGRIYFNTRLGRFTCLEPTAGNLVWAYEMGGDSRGPMTHGPDGTIYIGFNSPNASFAMVRQTATEFFFDRLAAPIGSITGGSVLSLQGSDDVRATAQTPNVFTFSRQDPNIRMEMEMDCPQKVLKSFELVVEASCPLADTTQTVELFNRNTNQFEILDTRTATQVDSTVNVSVTTNASRFVNPGNGLIRMRVNWFNSNGPRIWTAMVDQAYLRNVIPEMVP